jgi:hypothetical protein
MKTGNPIALVSDHIGSVSFNPLRTFPLGPEQANGFRRIAGASQGMRQQHGQRGVAIFVSGE